MNQMRQGANEVAKVIRSAGYEAFFAGGSVRDLLLGREPKDFDLITNATPQEVDRLFKRTVLVGANFGVIRVLWKGNREYEVASYRSDGAYSDGRRPDEVQYSQSKEEDVKRRDFTVNALLMDPFTNEVFDFVEGLKDLEAGLIRAVGNPDRRFQEDRLRLLRAIRFASRFGFEIETQTMNAICAHAEFIKDVSEERIVMELHGIWSSSRPEHGMALLTKTGLTTAIFNDLPQTQCAEFLRRFGIYATCAKGEIAENQQALGWALVFDLCEIERLDMSLRSLKLSRSLMRKIQNVLSMKESLLSVQTLQTAQSIRTALADDFQLALCFLQAIQNEDSACLDTWRRIQDELRESPLPALPLLTGRQLADLGYTPGPIFKKILRAVEDEVFERRLCTTDEALLWVQAQDWSQ